MCPGAYGLKKQLKSSGVPELLVQLVKRLTPDFDSGHDLKVVRFSPLLGSALGVEPA